MDRHERKARKTALLVLYMIAAVFTGSVTGSVLHPPALAQDGQNIDMEALKDEFFSDLTEQQIISLLRTVDRSEQLTSVELGAKYKWGYIPPDRTPPFSLANWWDSLSDRRQRSVRLDWFRNHYQELDVDRAARELGMKNELLSLYRKYETQQSSREMQFEQVSFPEGGLDYDTRTNRSSTGPSHSRDDQRVSNPGSSREPSPSGQNATGPDEPTMEGSKNEDREGSSRSVQKNDADPDDTDTGTRSPVKNNGNSSDRNRPDTGYRKKFEFAEGTVVFERIGNEIRVVRRESASDTHLKQPLRFDEPEQRSQPPEITDEPPLRSETGVLTPPLRFRSRSQAEPSPPAPRSNEIQN